MSTLLLDTSTAVALVIADHERHDAANEAVGEATLGLAGHAAFETFSVLTRLPGSKRRRPGIVQQLLEANFPASVFLSSDRQAHLHRNLAELGISGGQIYDALVAAAALEAGELLLTSDRRASETYRVIGAEVRII